MRYHVKITISKTELGLESVVEEEIILKTKNLGHAQEVVQLVTDYYDENVDGWIDFSKYDENEEEGDHVDKS